MSSLFTAMHKIISHFARCPVVWRREFITPEERQGTGRHEGPPSSPPPANDTSHIGGMSKRMCGSERYLK